MNTQVKVPDFMLTAAVEVARRDAGYPSPESDDNARVLRRTTRIIEAALRALMERPMVPTEEQTARIVADWREGNHENFYVYCSAEWQRRMFLTPTNPRRDKIRRILHTFGILSEDEKIDAILSAFEEGAEK